MIDRETARALLPMMEELRDLVQELGGPETWDEIQQMQTVDDAIEMLRDRAERHPAPWEQPEEEQ